MGLDWDTFWSLRPWEFVLLQEGYWDRMELEDAMTSRIHATLDAFFISWFNSHTESSADHLKFKEPADYNLVAKIRNPVPKHKVITPAGSFTLEDVQKSRNRAQEAAEHMLKNKLKGRVL